MNIGQHFYGTLTCEAREQTHTNTMKCCFFDQKSAGKGLQKMISRTSTPLLGSTFLALSPGRSVNKHQYLLGSDKRRTFGKNLEGPGFRPRSPFSSSRPHFPAQQKKLRPTTATRAHEQNPRFFKNLAMSHEP